MVCSRCNKSNTEYSEFTITVPLEGVAARSRFSGNRWTKRIVAKYVSWLLRDPIKVDVLVCQSCTSRMFRKLDKDK